MFDMMAPILQMGLTEAQCGHLVQGRRAHQIWELRMFLYVDACVLAVPFYLWYCV